MALAGYKPVIEYCGGTEIGGGYITGYARSTRCTFRIHDTRTRFKFLYSLMTRETSLTTAKFLLFRPRSVSQQACLTPTTMTSILRERQDQIYVATVMRLNG